MADTRARPRPDSQWTPDLDPNDLRELQAVRQDPTKIIARLPKESSRLGYYSTLCLIANRLIGMSSTREAATCAEITDHSANDRVRRVQLRWHRLPEHSKHRSISPPLGLRCLVRAIRCGCVHRTWSHHPAVALRARRRKDSDSAKRRRPQLC